MLVSLTPRHEADGRAPATPRHRVVRWIASVTSVYAWLPWLLAQSGVACLSAVGMRATLNGQAGQGCPSLSAGWAGPSAAKGAGSPFSQRARPWPPLSAALGHGLGLGSSPTRPCAAQGRPPLPAVSMTPQPHAQRERAGGRASTTTLRQTTDAAAVRSSGVGAVAARAAQRDGARLSWRRATQGPWRNVTS